VSDSREIPPRPACPDPWQALRALTPARIALGRSGAALPTAELLRFGLDHARARDAVQQALDADRLATDLAAAGFASRRVHSLAADRREYLLRPDLGRRLPASDADALRAGAPAACELCWVLADGLSAAAVQNHALPLLQAFFAVTGERYSGSPLVIAEQARVALGDEIGEALRARAVVVLIGERPGLSSPDSLGVYLTLDPRAGRTDAERNCISNVRPAGLPPAEAARRLAWLLDAALRLGATGVALKDQSGLAGATLSPIASAPRGIAMRVGFIGLGEMGRPLAAHLLAAGHPLAVWARRPEVLDELVAQGARRCASAVEVAAGAEVLFTMLTADADVREILAGPAGAALSPGSVAVDLSTIGASTARELARTLAARGVAFLDAPVSGGVVGARAATLAIMVGGEAAALARVRPLFACFGKTVVHVGPAGAGQVAKACNQMVMVATIEACAEAIALVRAHGVDPGRALQALAGGSAASRVLEVFGGRMLRGDFTAGVQARLHHKDYAIILAEAHALGVSAPLAGAVAAQLAALMAQGFGGDDTSSLLRVLDPRRESEQG
jgi:2-hydroxy-3-oxopropionate reductase